MLSIPLTGIGSSNVMRLMIVSPEVRFDARDLDFFVHVRTLAAAVCSDCNKQHERPWNLGEELNYFGKRVGKISRDYNTCIRSVQVIKLVVLSHSCQFFFQIH